MLQKTLNTYKLGKLLGQGGMGAVYEALDTRSGAQVAVKLLHSSEANQNNGCLSRFRREVQVAGSIDTPHIAALLDAGADPETGAPFMVMERLEGEDMNQLLRRVGSLAPHVALRIAAQVCEGLMKAHEKGIIHRDIKPANLFLSKAEGGRIVVKILDFGIAKLTLASWQNVSSGGLTRTGSLLGSPQYMSPEQVRMARTVDTRADVWSLGVVLYHALSGHVPHEELDTFGDLIIAICSELPKPLQEIAPWVPAEVAAIVQKALSFDPGARFANAAEMLQAIQALLPDGIEIDESMLVSRVEAERMAETPAAKAAREARSSQLTLEGPAAAAAAMGPATVSRPWWRLPWSIRKAG